MRVNTDVPAARRQEWAGDRDGAGINRNEQVGGYSDADGGDHLSV